MSRPDLDPMIELVRDLSPLDDEQVRAASPEGVADDLAAMAIAATDEQLRSSPTAPRRRVRRRALALVTPVVVLIAVVLLGWPTGTPPVIADWRAEPQPLSDSERAALDDWCRGDGMSALGSDHDLVLADARGRMTVALYEDGNDRLSTCVRYELADTDGDRPAFSGSATTHDEVLATEDRPLAAVRGAGGFAYPPERVATSGVHGLVTDEVAAVTGVLDDGRRLEAVLEEGRFHGWWPQDCPSLWRPGLWIPDWFRDSDPRVACAPWLERLEAVDADGEVVDVWTPPLPAGS